MTLKRGHLPERAHLGDTPSSAALATPLRVAQTMRGTDALRRVERDRDAERMGLAVHDLDALPIEPALRLLERLDPRLRRLAGGPDRLPVVVREGHPDRLIAVEHAAEQLERVLVGVAVAAVRRDHVVLGADAIEQLGRDVPDAA